MTNHPITPPPELIEEWIERDLDVVRRALEQLDQFKGDHPIYVAIQAAKWGADQELEACCEWLEEMGLAGNGDLELLRADRRPKPSSLKEQSLALIDLIQGNEKAWDIRDLDVVRRALEQLDD